MALASSSARSMLPTERGVNIAANNGGGTAKAPLDAGP
jgi:hypothetical protein